MKVMMFLKHVILNQRVKFDVNLVADATESESADFEIEIRNFQ